MHNCLSINWPFLCLHWKRVAAGMLLGLAIAGTIFVVTPQEWQSSALIQVGQSAGAALSNTQQSDSTDIVVAKIMRPAFIKAAMQRAGRPDMAELLLPAIYKGKGRLHVRSMNHGTIILTLRAPTPELARQLMDSVAAEVLEEQNKDLEARIRYVEQAFQKGKKVDGPHDDEISATMESLSASMVGEAEVLGAPVAPDPISFAALGLVLGAVLAAGLLYRAKLKA